MSKLGETSLFLRIPPLVSSATKTLEGAGFEAYLIGGCTRDLLLGRKPKDWDITTNATPEQIISLFPKTFYENSFGTVGVVNEKLPALEDGTEDTSLKIIEITPYRQETAYSDNRRPDSVQFSQKIDDDLGRRDFTINALALKLKSEKEGEWSTELVDLFEGIMDLHNRFIRTVGNPDERFKEDALRLLRAIRLASELDFTIEPSTEKAILEDSALLKNISVERIRDELTRLIMSAAPAEGLKMAKKLGILHFVIPELEESFGVEQNKAHSYDVWEHLLKTLEHSAKKEWPLDIRLAALLHDISKPATRRWSEEKKEWTFYGHEVVGARTAEKILIRLRYPKDLVEKVTKLVRWHMFFSDTDEITLSAVRRLLRNVGKENIWDLMNVRICDRVGTGRPKEDPYRLRKYKSMIEEALRDPISVGMLKIDGSMLISHLKITPGPKIGYILHALLEEVIEDPKLNTIEYLQKRAEEMVSLPENALKLLGESGKDRKDEEDEKNLGEIRKKYWVK